MSDPHWHPELFRSVSKAQLYRPAPPKRKGRWFGRFATGTLVFWLLSKSITPWTGLFQWERAFPELGLRLADAEASPVNAWVIGSSTVQHHVLPALLDSVTQPLGLQWYNFGFQSAAPPESFFLAHELLNELPINDLKLVVFEVQPEESLPWEEVASLRHAAQLTFPEMIRRIAHLPWRKPGSWSEQLEQARIYVWGWVQHVVGFLRPSQHLSSIAPTKDPHQERGFVALEEGDWETGRLRETHLAWHAQTEELLRQQVSIARDFDLRKTLENPTINWDCEGRIDPILAQMDALHRRCEVNGIRCIFHFQKLWETNGCLYYAALERWGPATVLESMGYAGVESLYHAEDRYDESHFLRSGAMKFTRHLGEMIVAATPSRVESNDKAQAEPTNRR